MASSMRTAVRLLVVDDDTDLRLFLQELLTEEGYDVDCAESLEEALAYINARVYTLIVTDLLTHSVVEPLRSASTLLEAAQPTPVMALTGWSVQAKDVAKAGLARLLPKPFDLADLISTVHVCSRIELTPQHERWAETVARYCAAANAGDLDAAAELCAPDLRLVVVRDGQQRKPIPTFNGLSAWRAFIEQGRRATPGSRFEEYVLFPRVDGVSLRAVKSWFAIDSPVGIERHTVMMAFQFTGGQISHITYRMAGAQEAWIGPQVAAIAAIEDMKDIHEE